MSVPDILDKVFKGFPISKQLQGTFKPRNYCVQYRESDFDFASRLMEEEGIYYYFEHKDGKDTMILSNDPQAHKNCPAKSTIPFYNEKMGGTEWISSIRDWQTQFQLQAGKVTRWDHHF
jgi:type VI secretion system secreted protein VgrG